MRREKVDIPQIRWGRISILPDKSWLRQVHCITIVSDSKTTPKTPTTIPQWGAETTHHTGNQRGSPYMWKAELSWFQRSIYVRDYFQFVVRYPFSFFPLPAAFLQFIVVFAIWKREILNIQVSKDDATSKLKRIDLCNTFTPRIIVFKRFVIVALLRDSTRMQLGLSLQIQRFFIHSATLLRYTVLVFARYDVREFIQDVLSCSRDIIF